MLFLQNRLKVCPRGLLYSGLGLDIDLKLLIYNWRPEGFIDFKVLNIGDTSEWSVHWIQPCRSTEKGLWKTHCLYCTRTDYTDYIVKYCTYWQADPFGHCTLCHLSTVHSVPIISLGERLYYLAVLSYTFFNILIRIQPGQWPWGPCHSFLCGVLAGEYSTYYSMNIHSSTSRFTILPYDIGILIF